MTSHDVQATHWQGCWHDHHPCALAEIDRLNAINRKLLEELAFEVGLNEQRERRALELMARLPGEG